MKIAVLVFGEYRELDNAIKSWGFLNEFDCDVYFSTWNVSKQIKDDLNINIVEEVTTQRILNHIPNATISIKNEDDVQFLNGNTQKMFYHWKESFNMMRDSNKDYDTIMLLRPDLHFELNDHSIFEQMCEPNTLYSNRLINASGYVPPKPYLLTDTFYYGNYNDMFKFIDGLDIVSSEVNPHKQLYKLSTNLNLKVQIVDFDILIMRPTLRGVEPLTFDIISEKFYEWKFVNTPYKKTKLI
jgi:hypothetical protein